MYMGLHNLVPEVPPDPDNKFYPPVFPVPPAVAGGDHLPDNNYFLLLADQDDDEGLEGTADKDMEGNADGNVEANGNPEVPGQGALPAGVGAEPVPPAGPDLDAQAGPDGAVPQHGYNLHPCQGRDYSHRYGADKQVDEASFFQSAGIPGVDGRSEYPMVPNGVDTDMMAHRIMIIIASKVAAGETHISLKQSLKQFGAKGEKAVFKELDILQLKQVFAPQQPDTLTKDERGKALESLMFLERKRMGAIKGRLVADGSKQRDYIQKSAAASPTVMTESVLITTAIKATEGRDVAVIDFPGAFLNADMDEVVHMVLHGRLAELMVKFAPEIYHKYVTLGVKGEPLLYVTLQKRLYGCLQSALLFYLKLVADLEGHGFRLNPYDPCVANKMINGHQTTLTFHVDNTKISHRDSSEVTNMIDWFKAIYGENVRFFRGTTHDY